MKKWIFIISLLLVAAFSSLNATPLMTEDFAIPPFVVGNDVAGTNGWAMHSGTTGPWLAKTASLTYTNYSAPGEGGSCGNTVVGSYDINKTFTAVTTGDLYAGFLINASPTSTSADYAINFGTPPSSFYGKIWFQKDATLAKYRVGIIKTTPGTSNVNIVWSGYDYDPGTTYLYILKYSYKPGTLNDEVRLWINPPTPGTETTATLTCISTAETGADPTTMNAFMLRQGNVPLTIDAIRVATTWAEVYPAAGVTGAIDTGTTTSLTFNTPVGTPQTQTFEVTGYDLGSNITISAPTNYLLYADESPSWASSIEVSSATQTISVKYTPVAPGHFTTDVISLTADNADPVYLALDATATTVASITAVPGTLTFTAPAGTSPAVQSYLLTGTNLNIASTIAVTSTVPSYYQLSENAIGPWTPTLTLPYNYAANVYVKFTALGYGTLNGTVTNEADGLTTTVTLNGTGTGSPMNIAVGTTITQDFDAMGVTLPVATVGTNLPTDWKADKISTARTLGTYSAGVTVTDVNRCGGDNLSTTAGNGIWNFGAGPELTATDRCIGFVSSASATKSGNLYAKLTNTGATAITALEISYNAEKYRTGTNAAGYQIQMYYSLDGIAWTSAGPDFLSAWPADATTLGYTPAPGDTKAITAALLPVNVAAAGTVYLAWNYSVSSGATTSFSQALGVDDVVITGRALDIVAVPTFSPLPGIVYTATQDVYLSCATAGASIRYTTDGVTEPSATVGTPYTTGPITISATTTIKAIGYKTGWVESAVTTGTYTFPVNVANIAALRLGTVGLIPYRLTGEAILTLQSTTATQQNKYIQDATGAIQIFDNTLPFKMTTSYNLGDGITGLVGTLTLYNQMLEFIPLQDAGAATHTSGYVPTPVNVTLAALDASYQAKLIHITNVSIDPLAVSPFAASTNYVITDPSGAGVLRTAYSDLDYIGAAFTTSPMDYTGICLQYNTALQLVPRSLAEITVPSALDAPINVIVTVDGDDIHLDWDAVTGATGYKIQYSDVPYGTFNDLDTSVTNSYIAVGEASLYGIRFYQVRATN